MIQPWVKVVQIERRVERQAWPKVVQIERRVNCEMGEGGSEGMVAGGCGGMGEGGCDNGVGEGGCEKRMGEGDSNGGLGCETVGGEKVWWLQLEEMILALLWMLVL